MIPMVFDKNQLLINLLFESSFSTSHTTIIEKFENLIPRKTRPIFELHFAIK